MKPLSITESPLCRNISKKKRPADGLRYFVFPSDSFVVKNPEERLKTKIALGPVSPRKGKEREREREREREKRGKKKRINPTALSELQL